jgi:hypothetical protein
MMTDQRREERILTAQLTTAYQQLSRELASDQIKVVGPYTIGKVIGEGELWTEWGSSGCAVDGAT